MSRREAAWPILGGVAIIAALVGVVCLFGFFGSLKSTDAGQVCVVREGGPFDGRDIIRVRQPGEGVTSIGIWNSQDCMPSTERDWVLSSNPNESDNGADDKISVPTSDAVNVNVEGQALFRLTTDEDKLKRFYRAYGRRNWDGKKLAEDDGFNNFLRIRFRPVLVDALRQSIGSEQCTNLNNLCQYVQEAQETITRGEVREINNSQNLARAQEQISEQMRTGLRAALGDDYFEGVRFQNLRIDFDPSVRDQITTAQTKRTEVATATLEAQRKKEEAQGNTAVAEEEAKQIRIKAESYNRNPAQAEIDKLRALCGTQGCQNLQVLGNGAGVITNLR